MKKPHKMPKGMKIEVEISKGKGGGKPSKKAMSKSKKAC